MVSRKMALGAGLAALGLALGLWGIRWGLPNRAKLARVLPPGLDNPQFHQELMDSWAAMHKRLGVNLMLNPEAIVSFHGVVKTPAGWTKPPEALMSSVRSFHIRSAHEDEQTMLLMLSRLKPKKLQLNPHMFTYGTIHVYTVGACLAAGAVTGLVTLQNSLMPYLAAPEKMAAMYLTGRLLTVAAYVGCALLLLLIGGKYFDLKTGALAGVLFLLAPAAVVQAHVLKNHTLWTFFTLLTLYLSANILARGRLRDYALAGLAGGLTVGTFLLGWPACLIVAAAGAIRMSQGRPWRREASGVAVAALCAVGIFFLTNPYWILDYHDAMAEMKVLGRSAPSLSKPFLFIAGPLRRGITAPFLALMFAGAALAAKRGRKEPVLLLCLCAFLVSLAGTTILYDVVHTRIARYFLGAIAVGALLAARAALELWRKNSLGRIAAAAVVLNLALHGFTYARNFHLDDSGHSSKIRAGEWIEANLPPHSELGLLFLPQPSNAPLFRFDRYNLVFIEPPIFKTLARSELPRYFSLTTMDVDYKPMLEPNLSHYERIAFIGREELFPWLPVDETSTTANPVFEVYRLK